MDPAAEIRARMREREINGNGRERKAKVNRADGPVKSEKNKEAMSAFELEKQEWKERRAAKLANGTAQGDDDAEERMIQKGRDLQQQSRESLANSIRMAKEATDVGQETLMKMTAQREQMKKMDDDLDKTNESLNRSERVIRGMKSTIGGLKNLFSKPKTHHGEKLDIKDIRKDIDKDEERADKAKRSAALDEAEQGAGGRGGRHRGDEDDEEGEDEDGQERKLPVGQRDLSNETMKSKGAIEEFRENQKVEDEQLDELGDLLGMLKGQAKDMNKELKIQEKVVDHLAVQVDRTGDRVKKADTNVKLIK